MPALVKPEELLEAIRIQTKLSTEDVEFLAVTTPAAVLISAR
jgi:hypothetical protein